MSTPSDSELDAFRLRADPLADRVVEDLYRRGQIAAVNDLMRALVENDGLVPAALPPEVQGYLEEISGLPLPDPAPVRAGERLFAELGPEILLILGFYSLPAAYAAKKGVQVLYRTAYLAKRPVRRVFETTQMVIDVLAPGGLSPHGKGLRTIEKVRLMHAAVRHLLVHEPGRPWPRELGLPINQEDLAGTLMTFSWVVLDGLSRMGIHLPAEDQQAYLATWAAIGRRMGVADALIPGTVEEAAALTRTIRRRQIAASPEGVAMTRALLEGYQRLVPELLHGLPASFVQFFLSADAFEGQDVASLLEVPPADWTRIMVRALAEAGELIAWLGAESKELAHVIRFFSRELVRGLMRVERGGQRPPFAIPEHLQDLWSVRGA